MLRHTMLPGLFLLARAACAQAGPVFHWPLDETSGTVAHDIAGGSHGQLENGVLWDAAGHNGGAARFNEVSQRILLGPCDITTGGTGFSIALWAKPDLVTGEERTIVAKTTGPATDDHVWSLSFVDATAIRFRLKVAGITEEVTTTPSSVFSGAWYHLAATYDGAVMRIHLNGSLMVAKNASGAVAFGPEAPASMGAQSTGAFPYSGWVDDVRIYGRGLSDQEIFGMLLGPVTTAMDEERVSLTADGHLLLPSRDWNTLTLLDASGRTVREQRYTSGSNALHLDPLPSGMYMVCLRGQSAQWTRPLFVP